MCVWYSCLCCCVWCFHLFNKHENHWMDWPRFLFTLLNHYWHVHTALWRLWMTWKLAAVHAESKRSNRWAKELFLDHFGMSWLRLYIIHLPKSPQVHLQSRRPFNPEDQSYIQDLQSNAQLLRFKIFQRPARWFLSLTGAMNVQRPKLRAMGRKSWPFGSDVLPQGRCC